MTWEDYEVEVELRLADLHDRVHRGSYRPQPSRRTYIPKADGRRRPLATLGITDLDAITDEQTALIQKIHLLLAMYNAYQPRIFALSGWDLVGALPLPTESVQHLMMDGDTRWIQRSAYDLMDVDPKAQAALLQRSLDWWCEQPGVGER